MWCRRGGVCGGGGGGKREGLGGGVVLTGFGSRWISVVCQ